MPIEQALTKLRVAVRKNSKLVMGNLIEDFLVYRQSRKDLVITSRCSFCGSTQNLTREHILPKWIFEDIQNRHYVNQVNGQKIQYSKATIPACRTCNSELLNEIERHIKNVFITRKVGQKEYLNEDYENIIRWL